MNKKNLFPIITLVVIGVVVTALLAGVNVITSAKIAENEAKAITKSLQIVMPGGQFGDTEALEEDFPETVKAIYKEQSGMGDVVVLKAQGYASIISITVGVDADGKITKAVVTSEQESHGQQGMENYTDRFAGLNAGGAAAADKYSGATVTSNAIKNAIVDAMYALGYATAPGNSDTDDSNDSDSETALPRTDEQIKELAQELVGGEVEEKKLNAKAPNTLKKIYYHSESGSYVAYNVTSTKYVAVETESLVVIKNGAITKAKLLTWTVGHGVNPPEDYMDRYIGKDRHSMASVELITGATSTAANLTIAIKEAIIYSWSVPRIVGIVSLCLSIAAVATVITVYKVRRKRK